MKKLSKTLKNSEKAITLIALVITIIVLLILSGISISMLSGDNSILKKAGDAKELTGIAEVVESAKLDILAQIAENKGEDISKEQLKNILNKYFENISTLKLPDDLSNSDIKLNANQTYGEYKNILLSDIYDGKFSTENIETIGKKYDDSWIGKQITYSANGIDDWIILGQNDDKDILITTANPVDTYEVVGTLLDWFNYKNNLDLACSSYSGTIGKKNVEVKGARSITLEDINNAVGFSEPIGSVTIGVNNNYAYPNSDGSGWVVSTDPEYKQWTWQETYQYYVISNDGESEFGDGITGTSRTIYIGKPSNMKYISANENEYFVANKTVFLGNVGGPQFNVAFVSGSLVAGSIWNGDGRLCQSDESGGEIWNNYTASLRPVIIISANIPLEDLNIGDYWMY